MKKYLITILLSTVLLALNVYAIENASSTIEGESSIALPLEGSIVFSDLNCSGLENGETLALDGETAVACVVDNSDKNGKTSINQINSSENLQFDTSSGLLDIASTTQLKQILTEVADKATTTEALIVFDASATFTIDLLSTSFNIFATTTVASSTLVIDFSSTTPETLIINEIERGNSLTIEGGRTLLTTASSTMASSTLSAIDITPEGLDIVGGEKTDDPLFVFSSDAKIVYGDEDYEVDNEKVVVGNKSSGKFNPEVKFERFEGETDMRIWSEEIGEKDALRVGNKTKWKADGGKKTYAFYTLTPEQVGNEEGGFEYEITLNKKPNTNITTLKIETTDLEYFYQPPLDKEDFSNDPRTVSCTQTECFNGNGERIRSRPENVIGSYAVYHKTKQGDYAEVGGKNYKTGKAFHIYRPKIIDNKGDWIWAEMNIDEQLGILTITIPQDFLDKAIYPVIVDPTIGFTGVPASSEEGGDVLLASKFTATSNGDANPGTMFVYLSSLSECSFTAVGGVYADGSVTPVNKSRLSSNVVSWTTSTLGLTQFSASITWNGIINGDSYWLSINNEIDSCTTTGSVGYDTSTGIIYSKANNHNGTIPATWPSTTDSNFAGRLGTYVQFTAADSHPSSFWWNFIKKITPMVFAAENWAKNK